jgi:nicotinamide-nucleotide amidase
MLPPETLEQAELLLAILQSRQITLATAESCTGGLVAGAITEVPGSSAVLDRGFVTYSNEAKNEMLGIEMALIEEKDAVSKEVAIAMAEGALANSRAHIALAITGFADAGDEPGLVHFGCARAGRATAHREEHFGPVGRGATRVECMRVAVEMMTEML